MQCEIKQATRAPIEARFSCCQVQHTDVQKLNYIFNNYKSAEELAIKAEDFDALFQSKKYKNGCIITNSMNEYVLIYLQQIEDKSKKVLDLIDQELINVDKSI